MNRALPVLTALLLAALPYAAHAQAEQPPQGQAQQQQQGQAQQQPPAETQQQQDPAQQPAQVEVQPDVEALSVEQVDPHFVWVATQDSMAELQRGQLADRQGMSQDVVDFGRMMVEHHTELNQQLLQLAHQLGVEPPQELSPKQKLSLTALAATAGEEFDTFYVATQVRHHGEAVQLYRFIANDGLDEQVRSFAEATLPTLEQHLEMAELLARAP